MKYIVSLFGTKSVQASVLVEADDEEDAKMTALENADCGRVEFRLLHDNMKAAVDPCVAGVTRVETA